MTARKSTTADKDQTVDTADKAGETETLETTTKASEDDGQSSTKANEPTESDTDGAASGEVEGGVKRGDTGLDEEFFDDLDAVDAPSEGGTVREGDLDVPYFYLTANDIEEGAKIRTADSDDEDVVKWNVQTTADDDETPVGLVPKEQTPGQTFTPDELPNLRVMEKAGIDVAQFLSGLPVRAPLGEGEQTRRGIPA